LIAFGKLKTPGLRSAADYYLKLLRPWVPLEEIELKPLPVPDKAPATRQRIQTKEALLVDEKLSSALSGRGAFYVLDEGGKVLSTRQWAELVRDWQSQSVPEVGFCLGSSLGFSDAIRKRARGVLSLGPQTLSHELARVVLLEQLYRAWSVTRGHPYHNEG
jgi:23S rRNA (pseudouridine1915-N3)-methyltransferase